jgi:hypothetical protein
VHVDRLKQSTKQAIINKNEKKEKRARERKITFEKYSQNTAYALTSISIFSSVSMSVEVLTDVFVLATALLAPCLGGSGFDFTSTNIPFL